VHGTAPYPPPRTHPLLWVRILVRRLLEARILGGQRRAPRARGTCDGDGGADGQVDDHSHAEGCGGDGARPPGPSPEMGRGNVWYVGMGGGVGAAPRLHIPVPTLLVGLALPPPIHISSSFSPGFRRNRSGPFKISVSFLPFSTSVSPLGLIFVGFICTFNKQNTRSNRSF